MSVSCVKGQVGCYVTIEQYTVILQGITSSIQGILSYTSLVVLTAIVVVAAPRCQ